MKTLPKIFSEKTEYCGIKMRQIGQWSDLTAYYEGSDGNAWSWSNGATYGGPWRNDGPMAEFVSTFSERRRGQLF